MPFKPCALKMARKWAEKGIAYAIDDDLGRKDTEGVVGSGQKRLELLTNWLND
jgi:hypothetical protein